MKKSTKPTTPTVRGAIYTRKSTEEGLDQDFNSLDAQRDAGEPNYVRSVAGEGWACLPDRYDDGRIAYEFVDMHVKIPSGTGPQAEHAEWVFCGTLKIRTSDLGQGPNYWPVVSRAFCMTGR